MNINEPGINNAEDDSQENIFYNLNHLHRRISGCNMYKLKFNKIAK